MNKTCHKCNGLGWYKVQVGYGIGVEQEQCKECCGTGYVETQTQQGFMLIKEKGDERSTQQFDTEHALRDHLLAMWEHTDWHLVAVCKL